MRLNEHDYETEAFNIVKKYIDGYNTVKEAGKSPAKMTISEMSVQYSSDKYDDDNTTIETGYWTRHNENKLQKYIKNEIKRRLASV